MKLIKLVLLFVGLIFFSACSSVETDENTNFAAEVGGIGLSLAHPQSWEIQTEPSSVRLATAPELLAADEVQEGAVISIYVLPSTMLASDDLMVLMNAEVNKLESLSGAVLRGEATAVTINNHAGYTAVFDSLDRTNVIHLVVIQAEKSVAIGFGYVAREEETTLSPIVEQILNSIEMELLIE